MSLLFFECSPFPQTRKSQLINTMKTSTTHLALLVLASAVLTLIGTSCRTVRGFGQDVEHVGSHIERASR
jgi:predicted small secreted protein